MGLQLAMETAGVRIAPNARTNNSPVPDLTSAAVLPGQARTPYLETILGYSKDDITEFVSRFYVHFYFGHSYPTKWAS